jgi:hypothetical protein
VVQFTPPCLLLTSLQMFWSRFSSFNLTFYGRVPGSGILPDDVAVLKQQIRKSLGDNIIDASNSPRRHCSVLPSARFLTIVLSPLAQCLMPIEFEEQRVTITVCQRQEFQFVRLLIVLSSTTYDGVRQSKDSNVHSDSRMPSLDA